MSNAGMIYIKGVDGNGKMSNITKAVEYLKKAAKYENAHALNVLAYVYINGLGVNRNFTKAIKYL